MRSRSGIGRREAYSLVGRGVGAVGIDGHAVRGIDPDEPAKMFVLLAFEWTQAAPQSFCVNEVAS